MDLDGAICADTKLIPTWRVGDRTTGTAIPFMHDLAERLRHRVQLTTDVKKYRLLLVHVAGRMNRNNCVMRLRLCAAEQTIARIDAVWKMFWLPTQASRTTPWPRAA